MAHGKIKTIGILIFALSSCTINSKLTSKFSILDGTLAWVRQDWMRATTMFYEVFENSSKNSETQARDYALYGLASVYIKQKEYTSALERLNEISDSAHGDLVAGKWYQAGLIAYSRGQYQEATQFFRQSLEKDSQALDAKINYEISKKAVAASAAQKMAGSSGFREQAKNEGGQEALFDYVRQKEENRWKTKNEEEQNSKLPDH